MGRMLVKPTEEQLLEIHFSTIRETYERLKNFVRLDWESLLIQPSPDGFPFNFGPAYVVITERLPDWTSRNWLYTRGRPEGVLISNRALVEITNYRVYRPIFADHSLETVVGWEDIWNA